MQSRFFLKNLKKLAHFIFFRRLYRQEALTLGLNNETSRQPLVEFSGVYRCQLIDFGCRFHAFVMRFSEPLWWSVVIVFWLCSET